MAKKRDYKAEYRRRIQRGLAKGYTRSQARGHPGKGQGYVSGKAAAPRYDRKLEVGVKEMRSGKSLTAAARSAHVDPTRLRNYATGAEVVKKSRGRWALTRDNRERQVQIYSGGQAHKITVRGYEPAALVGSYMAAVKEFLATNNRANLAPFDGEYVTDVNGRIYLFETRPNALYRLDASGVESFEEIYKLVG